MSRNKKNLVIAIIEVLLFDGELQVHSNFSWLRNEETEDIDVFIIEDCVADYNLGLVDHPGCIIVNDRVIDKIKKTMNQLEDITDLNHEGIIEFIDTNFHDISFKIDEDTCDLRFFDFDTVGRFEAFKHYAEDLMMY